MRPTASTTILVLSLATHAARGADIIFQGSMYPECEQCTDAAVSSCSGDPYDEAFASCLCDGTAPGGEAIVDCVSVCDQADTDGLGAAVMVAEAWYFYCGAWYPEQICPSAVDVLSSDVYEELCGGIGTGSDGSDGFDGSEDTGSDSGSGSGGFGSDDETTGDEAEAEEEESGSVNTKPGFLKPTTTREGGNARPTNNNGQSGPGRQSSGAAPLVNQTPMLAVLVGLGFFAGLL